MSKEVDERIVKMEFQNKGFQENAEKTIKTLDELEQSLEFKSGISKSLDVVASNFTKMGVTAHRVIQNITDDVYNLGKNMVKSLTVDQIGAGFSEYELKMGSTQTIMASTGESLNVVNQKLKELNDYSDKTIYSLRDMTSNINKFTNAGVELTPAVNAMKGIANLAALSGANSEQASHAMYNFAQALSSGYVKLVDWKSIEIANMATVEFKEQLIDTALKLGTIRQEGDKYISTTKDMNGSVSRAFDATSAFNESLSAQWLTTDVLTQTLENYASETTDIGKRANKAATEMKTFTMVIGALKESAGSGWAQTMEIIFGNYEEAVELWTNLFHRIDGWLGAMDDERNKILGAWKAFSGRDMLIEGINNILSIFESLGKIVPNAVKDLLSYNKGWRYLNDSLETIDIGPVGNAMYEGLVKATDAFRNFTKALVPSEKTLSNMSDVILGLITIIRDAWSIASPIVGIALKILKILSPLLKVILAIGGAIGRTIYTVSELLRKVLNLGPAAKTVDEFLDRIYNNVNNWADKTVDLIGNIPDALKKAMDHIKDVKLPDLSGIGKGLMEGLTNAVKNFKNNKTLSSFFEGFFNTDGVKEAGRKIKELCGAIRDVIAKFVNDIKMELRSSGPAGEFLADTFDSLGDTVKSVISSIKGAAVSLGNALGIVTGKLGEFFEGFDIGQAIKLAQVVSFITVMIKFRTSLKSISDIAEEAKQTLVSVKGAISSFADSVRDVGKGVKMQFQAEAFKNIAYGLGVIVSSIIALSAIDKDKLENAVSVFLKISATVALLLIVVSEFAFSSKKASETLAKSTTTLSKSMKSSIKTIAKAFSAGIIITSLGAAMAGLAALVGAITLMLTSLSAIDASTLRSRVEILKSVFGMIAGLIAEISAIVIAIALIEKIPSKTESDSNGVLKSALSIYALAAAVSSLMAPILLFSKIDADALTQGMTAVSVVIGIVLATFAAIAVISKWSPDVSKNLGGLALVMGAFSLAIMSLIAPIFLLGSMDPEKLSDGLWALGHVIANLSVMLIALGAAVRIMGKDSGSAIKLSLAFGILAASVTVFSMMAPTILSNMSAITEAITAIIGAIASAIVASANDVIESALQLVDVVLNAIDKYLPNVLKYLGILLDSVLDWLEQNLPGYMDKLASIIGKSLAAFSKSAKENINLLDLAMMMGAVVAIILFVKQISKMTEDIKRATPAMLMLSGVIVIIGLVLNELVKNSKDSASAISASLGIMICIGSMIALAKMLPKMTESMKKVKIGKVIKMMVSLGLVMAGIIGVFAVIQKLNLDPVSIMEYGVGLGMVMYSLPLLIRSILVAQKAAKQFKKKDMAALGLVVAELSVVMGLIIGAFALMSASGLTWQTALAYSAGMSAVLLSLTLLLKVLSSISKESHSSPNIKPIVSACVKLALVLGIVGGTFALLAHLNVDPKTMLWYALAMSLVFLALGPLMKAVGVAQEQSSKMRRWRQFLGQTIELTVLLGAVFGMFVGLDKLGIDPIKMIGYALGMSLVFVAMVPMLKSLGYLENMAITAKGFNVFGGLAVDIIAIMGSLFGLFVGLDKLGVDPKNMVTRAVGLGIVFAALNPMLKGLGKAAEGAKDTGFKSFLGILVAVSGIVVALGGIFWALDKLDVDPIKMEDYAIGLSIAFVGLSPLIVAIGLASKWGAYKIKYDTLLAMAVMIGGMGIVIGAVLAVLSGINADPNKVAEYAKSLSLAMMAMTPIVLVTGLLGALFSKIKANAATIVTSGLAVIAVVSAAILIYTGIVGLLGALNFNGALGESLGKGTEVLIEIANGLGQFIGTLVGSAIGSGLGGFATAAQPFFDAMNNLSPQFGENIKNLAAGLLALSGAAFVEQVGNLFNLFSKDKDGSLQKLGKDLNAFAPEMVTLSDSLKDITPERAQVMKYAGEGLKAIIDAMPREGGWFQTIFGGTDMAGFATNLTSLGSGIVNFSTTVAGVTEDSISHAVECAKIAAGLYEALPPSGGFVQLITGFPDMRSFATNLPILGRCLVAFNNSVTREGKSVINEGSVSTAVSAAKMIAGLYDVLQSDTGLWPWLKGFPDLGNFATNVGSLGEGLQRFADKTKDIDQEKVTYGVTALTEIAKMQTLLTGDGQGGIIDNMVDVARMNEFHQFVKGLGTSLKTMSDNMEGINPGRMTMAVDALNGLTDMVNLVNNLGGVSTEVFQKAIEGIDVSDLVDKAEQVTYSQSLSSMAHKFKVIGQGYIQNLYIGLRGTDEQSKSVMRKTMSEIKDTLKSSLSQSPYNPNTPQWEAGRNVSIGFANGMNDYMATAAIGKAARNVADYAIWSIQKAADEHSPSKRSEKDGANLTKGYAIGIEKNASLVKKPSELVVEEAFNAMSDALSKAYKLMNENEGFQPVIAPVVDLSNARRSASELDTLFSGTNDKMNLSSIPSTSLKITRGVKIETDAQRSSTDLTKVTEGIYRIGSRLSEMESKLESVQVVLDSGALVGGMTAKLMKSMKKQQTNKARGVISSTVI